MVIAMVDYLLFPIRTKRLGRSLARVNVHGINNADLEVGETADLEICATSIALINHRFG